MEAYGSIKSAGQVWTWSRGHLGTRCWTHLRARGHAHTWKIQEIWDCTQNRAVQSLCLSVQSHIDHTEARVSVRVHGSSVSALKVRAFTLSGGVLLFLSRFC